MGWQCLILFFLISAPFVFWVYLMTMRESESELASQAKDEFEKCQEKSDKWGLL